MLVCSTYFERYWKLSSTLFTPVDIATMLLFFSTSVHKASLCAVRLIPLESHWQKLLETLLIAQTQALEELINA